MYTLANSEDPDEMPYKVDLHCLFIIHYVTSTIFQLNRDGSS